MSATATRARTTAPLAIPGPAGHRLLGMAGALRGDLLGTLRAGFAHHGDVVAYRVGPVRGPQRLRRTVVAFHHPDDVRRVFTDVESFTRLTTSYGVLRELFGVNLVTANGGEWRRQKRLLQPLFTRAAAGQYAELIAAEARAVVERCHHVPGPAIDAARAMEAYALRVLGRTLFKDDRGIDDDTIAALERLVPVVGAQVRARATQLLRFPLRWPTPSNRRFAETRAALHATIERVLARNAQHDTGPAHPHELDLLSRLRDARDPEGEQPLSEQEVRDQALIFLIAGHTTTSNALTSTLHLLGCHPQIQERVAASAAAGRAGADFREDDPVRAAVQEGLRLHPPSYVLGRHVGPGGTELGGRGLAPGTDVLVSPWITHRHPDFWSEPETFDPWRFVGADDRPPYAYFPFGGGARACIGRHFALLESTILVRALLERCRLESLDANVPMDQLISMRPAGPVRIRCHPR
ncbi:MAG TPA: cytochrome P450 [Conexibacter sp.]|jgi:cytochrome P450|nr:cytochrome P450 [Conexibacter sp.]